MFPAMKPRTESPKSDLELREGPLTGTVHRGAGGGPAGGPRPVEQKDAAAARLAHDPHGCAAAQDAAQHVRFQYLLRCQEGVTSSELLHLFQLSGFLECTSCAGLTGFGDSRHLLCCHISLSLNVLCYTALSAMGKLSLTKLPRNFMSTIFS